MLIIKAGSFDNLIILFNLICRKAFAMKFLLCEVKPLLTMKRLNVIISIMSGLNFKIRFLDESLKGRRIKLTKFRLKIDGV